MSVRGKWYIACVCDNEDSASMEMTDPLGGSCCGCIDDRDKSNRCTIFSISCGHSEPANLNTTRDIRARATLTAPFSSRPLAQPGE
jgi:hypothetical protein